MQTWMSAALKAGDGAKHRPPLVTVFGAGVAGLTTAHELIERGFDVQVVESRGHIDEHGNPVVEVGGMAGNQQCQIQVNAPRLLPFHFNGEARAASYLEAAKNRPIRADEILDIDASGQDDDELAIREWIVREFYLREFQPLRRSITIPGHVTREFFSDTAWAQITGVFDTIYEAFPEDPDWDAVEGELDTIVAQVRADFGGYPDAKKTIDQMYAAIREAYFEYSQAVDLMPSPEEEEDYKARIKRRLSLIVELHVNRKHRFGEGLGEVVAVVVRQLLVQRNLDEDAGDQISHFDKHLVVIGSESDFEAVPQVVEDCIYLRILGRNVPCEHGYRFFPASYRHLFDTMRRTPILVHGNESARSTFDNLKPSPSVDIALEDRDNPASIPRKSVNSIEELRRSLRVLMERMGLTARDMLRWDTRMLKFMTSCAARRRDYENVSWWEYIGGTEQDGYSRKAQRYIMRTPQALLGAAADHIDARTHAAVSVQLLLDHMPPAAATDMTLDGPTYSSWLEPWKQYLKLQGVRFCWGRLVELEHGDDNEAVPKATGPTDDDEFPLPEDGGDYDRGTVGDAETRPWFYVLALPYKQAADLVHGLYATAGAKADGDFETLWKFGEKIGRPSATYRRPARPTAGISVPCSPFICEPQEEEPEEEEPEPDNPANPLRDFSGLQFYFLNQVRVGKGHVYYPDAPWGLSSISQFGFWRERPIAGEDFLGQVSVDIGDWDTPHEPGGGGKSAWNSTRSEIAKTVWDQILAGLHRRYRDRVQPPHFVHIDRGMVFSKDDPFTVEENRMPYFVPLPCQWRLRPGLHTKPSPPHDSIHSKPGHSSPIGEAGAGTDVFYRVSHKRWVMAGTHMATYTRMTTMEAANESGRHAVRTLLHALMDPVDESDDRYPRLAAARDPDQSRAYDRKTYLMGEMPDIWSPEDHELPDLEPLKRLDELLFDENLPHFMDILGVIEETDRGSAVASVSARAKQVGARDWEFATGLFESLMPQGASGPTISPELEKLRKIMEEVVRGGTGR